MTDNLNVPADLTVTPDLRSTAASFMVLAASVVGPVPRDADGRRSYGYRLAQEAASLAAAFAKPMDGLTHFLAQQRASRDKAPAKGILRAVELVDLGTPRPGGRQSQKVKLTVESTAKPTTYTKPGDVQEFLSDFTNAVGFGDFEARARALIGQECLFHKYLEDTEGRSAKGSTATVVVSVTPLNGNGQARAAEPERAEAPAPQRSQGSVTRPTREAVAAAAQVAEQAEAERRAAPAPAAPFDWFVASGWRDQTACETARAALVARVEAAPPGAGLSFNAWVTARGWRWEDHWTAEETALASARLDEMVRNASQAERVLVGGGAPAYEPDQEPF